ncbi:MAG TPA: trigger factor [Burkholderiales bacterium]
MQVSVEATSTLGRRVRVVVPAEQFEREFVSRLHRFSQRVRMPGFRPGKVPPKVVEARYGGQLLEETAGELIERSLREAIGSHDLRPAGGTRIEHKPLVRGQGLEYTAEFEVYPEIPRLDLSGIEIERPIPEVSDADVDRTIENMRKARVTWNAVERPAQREDRVLVDFVARAGGEEVPGWKAQNQPIVLGAGAMFTEIEEGLIGAARDETRKITVNFPAEARNPAIAGKAVEFEIRVHEVAEPVLPALDEEFAKAFGVKEGGVEKLREEVRASLEREASERARTVLRRNVLKALRDANQFEIPTSLVEAEVERMKRLGEQARGGAAPPPDIEALYRERARVRVALGLILAEIIRKREIKPDRARVRARIEQMARDYEQPEKFIEWYYASPERLGEVESTVLEEQVVEQLLETAQVRDRPVPFADLLQIDVSIE